MQPVGDVAALKQPVVLRHLHADERVAVRSRCSKTAPQSTGNWEVEGRLQIENVGNRVVPRGAGSLWPISCWRDCALPLDDAPQHQLPIRQCRGVHFACSLESIRSCSPRLKVALSKTFFMLPLCYQHPTDFKSKWPFAHRRRRLRLEAWERLELGRVGIGHGSCKGTRVFQGL